MVERRADFVPQFRCLTITRLAAPSPWSSPSEGEER